MKHQTLSALAAAALFATVAVVPVAAMAAEESVVVNRAGPVVTAPVEALAAADALQTETLFDSDELAALAALETANAALEQQTAGLFGPRIGTIIIIIAAVLILVL